MDIAAGICERAMGRHISDPDLPEFSDSQGRGAGDFTLAIQRAFCLSLQNGHRFFRSGHWLWYTPLDLVFWNGLGRNRNPVPCQIPPTA